VLHEEKALFAGEGETVRWNWIVLESNYRVCQFLQRLGWFQRIFAKVAPLLNGCYVVFFLERRPQ
jgi:hypothetical protein